MTMSLMLLKICLINRSNNMSVKMKKKFNQVSLYLLRLKLIVIGFLFVFLSSCEKDDPQPEYGVPSGKYVDNSQTIMESSTDQTHY